MRKDNAVNCNSSAKKRLKEREKKKQSTETREEEEKSRRGSGLLGVVCPQARGASPCYGRCRESPQMGR
jgi:hypothetical protein